jgi:RNA polymerase sigma factor (TIGR02999 family)
MQKTVCMAMTLNATHDLIDKSMARAVVPEPAGEVTALLRDWHNPSARERLTALIYPELRRMAAVRMRWERSGHTLQPTALVSEVFLQLAGSHGLSWENRAHFFAFVSDAMRRILVDYARRRLSQKRGSGAAPGPIDSDQISAPDCFHQWVEIDDLLDELERRNSRVATVFKLHYFVGLTFDQVGQMLSINPRTAKRDCNVARGWLYAALQQNKVQHHGGHSTRPA